MCGVFTYNVSYKWVPEVLCNPLLIYVGMALFEGSPFLKGASRFWYVPQKTYIHRAKDMGIRLLSSSTWFPPPVYYLHVDGLLWFGRGEHAHFYLSASMIWILRGSLCSFSCLLQGVHPKSYSLLLLCCVCKVLPLKFIFIYDIWIFGGIIHLLFSLATL